MYLYSIFSFILLDYWDLVWGLDRNKITLINHLQILHNKAANRTDALDNLNWCPLSSRRRFHCCSFVFKALNNEIDFVFEAKAAQDIHSYCRDSKDHNEYTFIADWNSLPPVVCD